MKSRQNIISQTLEATKARKQKGADRMKNSREHCHFYSFFLREDAGWYWEVTECSEPSVGEQQQLESEKGNLRGKK